MKKLVFAAVTLLTLAGCANHAESSPEPTEAAAVAPAPAPTPEPEPEPGVPLPAGYPQVVDIATIPDQMRWAFEDDGTGQAVAVAEGVWAHLTPGATTEDAVNAMVFEGYCASKKALEREHLGGEPTPGMCW